MRDSSADKSCSRANVSSWKLPDHPARAIWELVGRLDLDGFYEGIECSAEEGGRPAYDPRLLISL